MADSNQNTGSGSGSGTTSGGGTSSSSSGTNTATQGDHDRVAMLSLNKDGTPDQHDPEFIGDKDAAEAAAIEQFKQQAVSAADVELREQTGDRGTTVEDAKQDPSVAKLEKAHKAAASKGEKAAKKAVAALSKKD